MVNFHDPAKVSRDYLTMLKLWHAADGVFIWEFFTTLDYEWSVIRGRRPYRWTIWVYSLVRLATLLAVIVNMIGYDVTRPINCQAWITFELIFAYAGMASASLLIVLRTIAIWNRKLIIIIIAMGSWLTNVSFFIEGKSSSIVRIRAAWLEGSCIMLEMDPKIAKRAVVSTLANDMIMLLTMLIGLLRLRVGGGGTFGLARLLWTQGIIWLFLATVAEVPPSVFICLNLNDPYDLMFQIPALVVMSIAATRMYRSLADSGSSDVSPQDGFQHDRGIVLEAMRIPVHVPPFSRNRMEVGIHTTSGQYPASLASHDSSYISTDGQLYDKPHELCLGDDASGESGGGK